MPRFQANFHLYAEEIDRAVSFYTDNFKFRFLGQMENENSEPWAALRVENTILWLGRKGTNSGLILLIDKDIEKFVAKLFENDVEFFIPEELKDGAREKQNVLETDWGKHAWFLDSEKNAIMLFQPFEM
ncbi:MAG: hypothetical protein JSW07_05590 [bacterium]|nr:MAG: hypothetical protein JSW07_05590 [bacterium]